MMRPSIRKLPPFSDTAAAFAELQKRLSPGIRSLIVACDGPPNPTRVILEWMDKAAAGDVGVIADLPCLSQVLRSLSIIHAGRFTYSARPRRRLRPSDPPVDIAMNDIGGALPVALTINALAELAIRLHGDPGLEVVRSVIEADQEFLRAISEILART